ncbi:MAG TPA: T9SS type A sorting domain-containing protein [Candidatus Kapabacteria bacterium]|nr:T9SS type A sorting domain-containing protein [Candidatus Kapabacteria bacterium]
MKRITLLLAVLVACYSIAAAQSGRAKDELQAATKAVALYASDAQLMTVQSVPGSTVNTDGTCPMGWIYYYISLTKDSTYLAEFNCGQIMVLCNNVSNSTYKYCGSIDATGSTWMNSDSVIAIAEKNGGEKCRSENSGTSCTMMLGKGLYAADTLRTVWRVVYSGSGNTPLSLLIDPVTGKLISNSANAVNELTGAPFAVQMNQNYPNPFSASTAISFTLNVQQSVTLAVYNQLGKQVAMLANRRMDAGTHSVSFDASNLPEGVYFYKLTAGDLTQTRQMIVVK